MKGKEGKEIHSNQFSDFGETRYTDIKIDIKWMRQLYKATLTEKNISNFIQFNSQIY